MLTSSVAASRSAPATKGVVTPIVPLLRDLRGRKSTFPGNTKLWSLLADGTYFPADRIPTGGYVRTVSSTTTSPTSARLTSASWWFRSPDGRLAVGQLPNPALFVWLAALVVGLFDLSAAHEQTVAGVRQGALLVWALDEVVRGDSPFRRVLGAVVLVGQLVLLVTG